ncbi:MAG: phenylphosphate carboxylase subunit gamma [Deltaproteobacteria bacterium]|nr:phenylphosphate carboxylase subunit gamma [Deltaproteobacteria bacterium]
MRNVYQYFIPGHLSELKQDVETEMTISSLAEGKYKYEAKMVKAKISSDKDRYPDELWLRFMKGQKHMDPWSIDVTEEVQVIPKEFR